jgi:20S proteasome subunit beta 4
VCHTDITLGLTIKFDFNCIMIDKDGIHKIDLKADDPLAEMKSQGAAAKVEAPNVASIEVAA